LVLQLRGPHFSTCPWWSSGHRELKNKWGLLDRLKWQKVPTKSGRFFDGYKEFLKSFVETDNVYFKCMVIDTQKYPLNNAKRWAGDALVGYQKFYCVFLPSSAPPRP
jgi:hypothetical protein